MSAGADAGDTADDELQRFREQWRKELLKGGGGGAGSSAGTAASAPSASSIATAAGPTAAETAPNSEQSSGVANLDALERAGGSDAYRSLFAYTRAVLAERRHDLNAALEAYKRAFRLHDKPDRLYHRACTLLLDNASGASSTGPSAPGKGKGKTLVKVEGVEITTLLDEPLSALLRASLEPGTDDDASAKTPAPVRSVVTPRTSPTTVSKPLPQSTTSPTRISSKLADAHLPRAPLIPSDAPGPSHTSPSPPANRYTAHRNLPTRPPSFDFRLPPVKSTNRLEPILEQLLINPRPDRETMLQRSRQSDDASKMVISPAAGAGKDKAENVPSAGKERQGDATASVPVITSTSSSSATPRMNPLAFYPLEEEAPCPFSLLPDEILLAIAVEVARPRGKRGEKLPLPIGLHSVPGAPTLGSHASGKESGGGKQGQHGHHAPSSGAQGSAASQSAPSHSTSHNHGHVHNHPLGLAVNLALPDVCSLEALGRTCTKWRVLTSGAAKVGAGGEGWGVWRLCVRATLLPPLLPALRSGNDPAPHDALLRALYAAHSSDWRTLYLEHPRVRLNGCYIASCRYTRPGLSEDNVWISVVHVVEFYRSIRLLPDGTCLSLLTTETPAETVRRMEPGWKRKGMCVGRWKLFPWGLPEENERVARRKALGAARRRRGGRTLEGEGATPAESGDTNALAQGMEDLLLENGYPAHGDVDGEGNSPNEDGEDDDDGDDDVFYEYDTDDEWHALSPSSSSQVNSSPPRQPKLVLTDLRDRTLPKYAFRMVFALKSGGRGKWNRLELETYESIHLGNGERLGLPLTHTKPFVFSVVRSY
ncbi:hypothetical protein OC842_004608 [Tilletia horrida]|uniref:F-box protein Hrt3/FBXO9 C-terminal domain-containing protein n=1 Tax=Tilletia horrida TaxID=155126 RepID=A0AAN6GBC0_9BASI|nr:hypothetical protein OC842_004608 [Tilletia horrida]